jgi:hypothetical protein
VNARAGNRSAGQLLRGRTAQARCFPEYLLSIWFESGETPAIVLGQEKEYPLTVNLLRKLSLMIFAITAMPNVYGQQGQWAEADNPTAKFMIDAERQWAEAACSHNKIAQKILAEDFQGTSPEGQRYTKSEEVSDTADSSKSARDCRLIDAKVRFFGDSLATAYGSESSVGKDKDGTERSRCLIWTDTWFKRNGNWQIIAAQDTRFDCK